MTLNESTLRTNTLLPGSQLGGNVYFQDPKRANSLFVVIPVADITLKFAYFPQSQRK